MGVVDLGVNEMGRRRSGMTPFVCVGFEYVDHLGRSLS